MAFVLGLIAVVAFGIFVGMWEKKVEKQKAEKESHDNPEMAISGHPGDLSASVTLDLIRRRAYSSGHNEDSRWEHEDEYRIDGTVVEMRTISKMSEAAYREFKKFYAIKDNVVQEAEIRDYFKDNIFADANEAVEAAREQVRWHAVSHPKLKYFIICSSRILSPFEIRKILQEDRQRIEMGCRKLLQDLASLPALVDESEYGYNVNYSDSATAEQKSQLAELFKERAWSTRKIRSSEFFERKTFLDEIDRWLGKVPVT
jgi:hypothetical protein